MTFPALRVSDETCEICGTSELGDSRLARLQRALGSVEGCALVLLLALACGAHALYLGALWGHNRSHQGTRMALAVANALATAALLAIAAHAAARCMRGANSEPPPPLAGVVAAGAALSTVAAAQVFLLATRARW